MPRRAKGPRLYLDPTRGTWAIRDGENFIRTGRPESERAEAEAALGKYLARKFQPTPSATPLIAEMLLAYRQEHAPHTRSEDTIRLTIGNLEKWWGDKRLSDVTARNCRSYASNRPKAAARRDLETLRAAINYWHREYGPLPSVPAVVMPPKSQPRERWLTRGEAARLLWAARRVEHLKRFILIGLYTGSRSGVTLSLRWDWIDFERGIMRRRGHGEAERETKRRPPVRLNRGLLAFLRRWWKLDGGTAVQVVHYNRQRVGKLRRSWGMACKRAGIEGIGPHVLRHTRATWLMQARVDPWEAAGSLGMTVETLTRTYAHHHPDWQRAASEV